MDVQYGHRMDTAALENWTVSYWKIKDLNWSSSNTVVLC